MSQNKAFGTIQIKIEERFGKVTFRSLDVILILGINNMNVKLTSACHVKFNELI